MPNETEDYNNFVRANLPAGMSYSANRYRYNNHSFYVFELAAWYYYYLLRVNSPSNLFSASEVGVWYDPSDLTTLFQDSAGTTPVTAAGQSVGLMLDKSKSLTLGAELVSNGDFSNGLTGWLLIGVGNTTVVSGGVAQISGTSSVGLRAANIMTIGNTYRISLRIRRTSGSAIAFYTPNIAPNPTLTTEWQTVTYYAAATDTKFEVGISGVATGTVVEVDDISVKLLAGNHATQATAAQRPTYGIHPYSGVRNRLLYSEQLNNAVWSKTDVTVVSNAGVAPDGSMTADTVVPTVTLSSGKNVNQISAGLTIGQTYVFSVYAKASGYNWIRLQWLSLGAFFNVSSGAVGNVFGGAAASVTSVGNGWYRCSIAAVVTDTTVYPVNYVQSSDSQFVPWLGDGTSGVLFWGDQFELGSTATAYQKVVTQYEVTEAGVPSVRYIGFDGVDDGMVTSAINFSATDAVTVFAGVRKLSDAARGMVAECGTAGGAASFALDVAPSGGVAYRFNSIGGAGTGSATTALGTAPDTAVLTSLGKISTDLAILRRNGAEVGNSTSDQGTGNYANAILYIGRRGGSSLPFNGNIYSLIVRGAESTTGQVTNTETWVNQKTGAY